MTSFLVYLYSTLFPESVEKALANITFSCYLNNLTHVSRAWLPSKVETLESKKVRKLKLSNNFGLATLVVALCNVICVLH